MTGPGEIDGMLLEREIELGLIEELVKKTSAGAGGTIFVEGPPGVGKTALLRAAAAIGEAAGLQVVNGRGSELEREFAFGVVRQMFERTVSESPDLLEGAAEPATAVFAPVGSTVAEVSFAPLHGLYWLVGNLAENQPLMIVADDLHWSDRASLRSLLFTVERIDDMPVIVVAATRQREPGAEQELLDDIASAAKTVVLKPEALSQAATMDLVRGQLPAAVETFGEACHRATGGNPFLLRELLVEIGTQAATGNQEDAAGVLDFGSERVGRAVRRRLRLLPEEVTRVARAVAILGPDSSVDEIASLGEVSEEQAIGAMDALIETHILQAGSSTEFVHPIVRGAVYDQIPPGDRVTLHGEAARTLQEKRADVERVAQHLLRVPPEGQPDRVSLLQSAAAGASARGDQKAASSYLERALREPPAASKRAEILHALARVEAVDGQRESFGAHFAEALELTDDPEQQARIAIDFGWARGSSGDLRDAARILSAGFDRLPSTEVALAEPLEALMIHFAFMGALTSGSSVRQRDLRLRMLEHNEVPLGTEMRAALGMWISATRPPAADAVRICEEILQESEPDDLNTIIVGAIGNSFSYCGELREAARLYDGTLATAARRGDEMTMIWQSVMRSDISFRLGAVRRAEAEARSAFDRFVHSFERDGLAWTEASLVNALVARGAIVEARDLLDQYPIGPDAAPSLGVMLLLVARANLNLAAGSSTAALQDAMDAGRMAGPITNPCCVAWRSTAALALANLDRREEAEALAREQLDDSRRFGIAEAEGFSLRVLGTVLPAGSGIVELRRSVEVLETGESRIEQARSLLELGAALRKSGERKEAATVLREALDLTSRCGASGLADRAHQELVAAGARPRRDRRMLSGPESLTASEERVAALAAEGLTNREIAQRQFVTVKAVEWHMRNVFRKLDITSRDQLSDSLS